MRVFKACWDLVLKLCGKSNHSEASAEPCFATIEPPTPTSISSPTVITHTDFDPSKPIGWASLHPFGLMNESEITALSFNHETAIGCNHEAMRQKFIRGHADPEVRKQIIDLLRKAFDYNNDDLNHRLNLQLAYISDGQKKAAIDLWVAGQTESLVSNAEPSALCGLGYLLAEKGQLDDAKVCFLAAKDQSPVANALLGESILLVSRGDEKVVDTSLKSDAIQEAKGWFDRAIKMETENNYGIALYRRCQCYGLLINLESLGDDQQAMKEALNIDYTKVLDRHRVNPERFPKEFQGDADVFFLQMPEFNGKDNLLESIKLEEKQINSFKP